MSVLKRLIHEVHRRSLWQVLGIYLAGSWVALQVMEQLTEAAGLPDWVRPFSLLLLVLGFPIVMATAFVQEGLGGSRASGTPPPSRVEPAGAAEDVERSRDAARGEAGPPGSGAAAPPAEAEAETSGPPQSPVRRHHRLFTWRNALLGGGAAFALLGIVTAGYMAMRVLGVGPAGTLVAKGLLDEREPLLISEFENRTEDPTLGQIVTEALRVDLAQSPILTVVEPGRIADVLARMERDPDQHLDLDVATEVAIRDGIKAVIAGEVARAGGGYVLTARLIAVERGEALVSARQTAADSTALLGAIDDLAKTFRERIGESLRTIRAEQPLAHVTTSNVEALRKYTQAIRAIEMEGGQERGIALLEEAVALDSSFAMAWRKLGVELQNRREETARAVEALSRAFRHRDRLTDRERYMTEASYFMSVTAEQSRAITAYENLLDLEPDDDRALNNVGNLYEALRDFPRAEEYFLRAASLDSGNSIPFTNAVIVQVEQGKYEDADAMIERSLRLFPDDPYVRQYEAMVDASRGELETAAAKLTAMRERWIGNLFWRAISSGDLAGLAATRGELRRAEADFRQAIETEEMRGLAGEVIERTVQLALIDVTVRNEPERGVSQVVRVLERHPLSELAPLDRPYLLLVQFHGLAGRPAAAAELLDEYRDQVGAEAPAGLKGEELRAEGALALAEGRAAAAAEAFRRSEIDYCLHCARPLIALALDRAGDPMPAIEAYEAYVESPSLFRTDSDRYFLGPSLERLGQLADQVGDLERAAKYYARFTELWAEADEELQPRVRAAQARLEEIARERG